MPPSFMDDWESYLRYPGFYSELIEDHFIEVTKSRCKTISIAISNCEVLLAMNELGRLIQLNKRNEKEEPLSGPRLIALQICDEQPGIEELHGKECVGWCTVQLFGNTSNRTVQEILAATFAVCILNGGLCGGPYPYGKGLFFSNSQPCEFLLDSLTSIFGSENRLKVSNLGTTPLRSVSSNENENMFSLLLGEAKRLADGKVVSFASITRAETPSVLSAISNIIVESSFHPYSNTRI